ncbi:helix-turn-helix domain-containing protein [Paenibacillus ginsengarvi]|uniref:AraC family transcriptional regulator n=1 Tax=Paenibacillus ginsengarvi TaxID=400777 RepID=A0A3B0CLV2_9BACL|nr:AraC family transcriptional regulator [Paenibacillus ginsengarvi]RKN85494.1 AraC family transcriptional regulator [Paenibacillus ginsengarvi]
MNHRIHIKSYVCAGPQPGFLKAEETVPFYVLLGAEAGAFEYGVGDDCGRASFGDVVIVPPDTMFRRQSLEDSITFHVFNFDFTEEASTGHGSSLPTGKITIGDATRLSSTYGYLRKAHRELDYAPNKRSLCGHLLADLLQLCELERHNGLKRKRMIGLDPLMQQAAGYIHRNVFGEMSLHRIASALGIKPSELTRRFRLAFGTSPIEYATRLRLEEVQRLLRETNETLDAIAARCGYENGSYLSRVFHAKIGVAPSAFRKRYQF